MSMAVFVPKHSLGTTTPQEKDVYALQELIELTKLVHLYGGTGGAKG